MLSLFTGKRWRGLRAILAGLALVLCATPPASAQVVAHAGAAPEPDAFAPGGLLAWLVLAGLGLLAWALSGEGEPDEPADSGEPASSAGADGGRPASRAFDDCVARTFDQAPVGMALLNGDNRLARFNGAFADLLGYSGPDLQDQAFTALIHPDDRESFVYLKQEILEGHASSSRMELRCLHRNGATVWVRAAFSRATGQDDSAPFLLIYLDDYSVQKEMEQAFWEQILRNEMILQTATDGFCLFGLDGAIMEVNAAFAAITGYAQEYMMGMPVSALQDADHRPAIIDQIPLVLSAGNQRFDTTIRRQDGHTAALSASLNLIDMGSQRFLFLSVRDVTEMHSAEQALRESRQMLQLVLDAIPTRVFWKDRELRFLGCNRAFAEDAGLKDQRAIVGMTDFEMPWKAQAEAYRSADRRVISAGETLTELEESQQRADGRRYWLRTSKRPLRDPDGTIVGVMGTYEDVTERKQDRDRLEQSETRLQSIFNNAAAGILLLDAAGNFLHFNRHWAEMLGYEIDEVYSLDLWDVTLPEEAPLSRDNLRMLAAREIDGYTLEKRYRRKDGSAMWARVSVSGIINEADELETVVAMITDITERKQAEQAMYASESRYRSLFEDMPIGLLELELSAVKATLEALHGSQDGFSPRDYFYSHPDEALACLGKLRLLNVNRAALALFEASDHEAIRDHLLRSLQEEAFEDFRLLLISLAEGKLSDTLEAMLQTVGGNPRSVSLHISVMPQYEETWGRVLVAVQDITARLEAQHAVRESEERYRRLFEDVPISLWEEDFSRARRVIRYLQARGITDLAAHFAANPDDLVESIAGIHVLDVNRHTLQMYNATSKEDFLGPLTRLVSRDDHDLMLQELVALASGQYEISLETELLINDMPRYMAINLSVAPGYENTWGRVLVSMTDISQLKAAEAAEHEQRTLAEALRDTAAALVGSLDQEVVLNRILDNLGQVVPHHAANIGLVEGDMVRIHSWRGYHDLMGIENLKLPLSYASFQQMYTTGDPLLVSDVTRMDDWVDTPGTSWVKSYVGVPVRAHGQVVGFLNLDSAEKGFFTKQHVERLQAFADQAAIAIENAQLYDEIRQHAAELQHRVEQRTIELEHERAQLQAILDAMGEGVVYTEDNDIRYVNDQFLNMLGYTPDDLQGSVDQILTQSVQFEAMDVVANWQELLRILVKRRIWRGDARIVRQDGSAFDASLTITLVGTPGEEPVSIVTIVRDVSQERALEAQKDRFIANASHELRTPIANMKMRLYLLEKQPDRQAEHMEVLHYVAARMGKLVEELLDVSRFERGVISLDRQVVDLRTLVEHAVTIEQPTAQEKGLRLAQQLPPEALEVDIDPNRIMQVLNNLVANAINYTLEGGQIAVTATREGREAVVRVADTGIGIPPESLDQIFEPFYRVNEAVARGTGLGLTISREIMDLHGGALTVESELEQGSTFTLRLPLVGPAD